MAKKKKSVKKTKAKVEAKADPNILCCEATGKRVKFKTIDKSALLQGEQRVFSSREVAIEHQKIEKQRATHIVHRNAIYANPARNVRRFSTDDASTFIDLTESIKERGVLVPLVVKRSLDHLPATYELVGGFRRFEATKLLGIDHLPITVTEISAKVAGLIENTREDMTPLEKAAAIKAIMEEGYTDPKTKKHKKYSQRQVAKITGNSQSTISDLLSLVDDIHPKVNQALTDGVLPVSKVAVLKQLPSNEQAKAIKLVSDLDMKDTRRFVQEKRQELGIESPRHKGKSDKKKRHKGRKFKVRNVADIVKACMDAEKKYFKKGSKKKSDLVRVQTLQWVVSILEKVTEKPVDPAEIERQMEEAAEVKKKAAVERLKKAREAKEKAKKQKGKPAKKKSANKPAKTKLPKPKKSKK